MGYETQCIIEKLNDIINLLSVPPDEPLKYSVYEGTLRALEEHAKRHPVHPYPMIYKEPQLQYPWDWVPGPTCGEHED